MAEPVVIPPPPNESRMFALLIGINEYKYSVTGLKKLLSKLTFQTPLKDLRGCVPDAENMRKYLRKKLDVSPDRIQTLYNDQATRENIKKHIQQLAQLPEEVLKKGDPILIFYAGHGSLADAPSSWEDTHKEISMILPHDFKPGSKGDDNLEQGIPNFVLDKMFVNIARAKGNNLTVIFDCCNSGSAMRKADEEEEDDDDGVMERGVVLDPDDEYEMNVDIDKDIVDSEAADEDEGKRNGSYVRLSACWSTETSRESKKAGHFTSALLERLSEEDGLKLTYRQAIRELRPIDMQKPQCEGANSSYIIFSGRAQSLLPLSYEFSFLGPFVQLSAGEADGVTKGDRFGIFGDGKWICDAIVTDIPGSFMSKLGNYGMTVRELQNRKGSAEFACAVQLRMASKPRFRVNLATTAPNSDVLSPLEQQLARIAGADDMRSIVSVLKGEETDLTVTIEKGEDGQHHAVFELQHPRSGTSRLYRSTPAAYQPIYRVIAASADFYWQLNRESSKKGKITDSIEVGLNRLKYNRNTRMKGIASGSFIEGNVAVIDYSSDKEEYGLSVTCKSGESLHVAAFFFNLSTLSIEPIFLPPIAANQFVEPTLNSKERVLAIGYRSSGWDPLSFSYPESNDAAASDGTANVGFIKIFFSHDYVDYERIIQGSPFNDLSAFDHLTNTEESIKNDPNLESNAPSDGDRLSGGQSRGDLFRRLLNLLPTSSFFRNGSSAHNWDTKTILVTLRKQK